AIRTPEDEGIAKPLLQIAALIPSKVWKAALHNDVDGVGYRFLSLAPVPPRETYRRDPFLSSRPMPQKRRPPALFPLGGHDTPRSGVTFALVVVGLLQYSAHESVRRRRFSKRSVRRYAASTALGMACARAASHTSRGKLVRSAVQSRNALRMP